jgi:hypothetical protein
MLQASVAAGPSGPVITLSGETDLTTVARVSALISGHLAAGTVELTIDVSGLRFAGPRRSLRAIGEVRWPDAGEFVTHAEHGPAAFGGRIEYLMVVVGVLPRGVVVVNH